LKKRGLGSIVMSIGILVGFGGVAGHAAQLVSAEEPEQILEIAKGFGSARLKTDSTGDPLIVGRINGTKYGIFFYGCNKQHKECDDIKFGAGWSGVAVSRSKRLTHGIVPNVSGPPIWTKREIRTSIWQSTWIMASLWIIWKTPSISGR